MDGSRIDDVDVELLALLQENARQPAIELADRIGVSDNTVHNRIRQLEEDGVVTGFTATLEPEAIGLELYFMFVCTVRISKRDEIAQQVRAIPAVTGVTELMTGQQNLLVKAVGATDHDITALAEQIDEFDVVINDENLIRAEHTTPLDYAAIVDGLEQDQ